MKLLTKIIGKAPSEMTPEELVELTKRNRARIRREIKEYRKLKLAIRESEGPKPRGRPRTTKNPTKSTGANALNAELKNLDEAQLNKILEYPKTKA